MSKKLSFKTVVILLLVLIIAASIYYVKGPLQTELDALMAEQAALEDDIALVTPYIAEMNKWNKELEALRAEKGDNLVPIANYDNFKAIVRELSSLFDTSDVESYAIGYGSPYISDSIANRSLSISYNCYSYNAALAKLTAINNSGTRYHISNLTITTSDYGQCSVSMSVYLYEYISDAQ